MSHLLLAVTLFGLLYPAGHFLISTGLPVFGFCFLFITLRVAFQIPLILKNGNWKIPSTRILVAYLLLGLTGTLLHFSEFRSLELGLNVSVISFLIFTHPLVGILMRAVFMRNSVNKSDVLRLAPALLGIYFLLSPELAKIPIEVLLQVKYLLPLLASACLSLWVILSESAMKHGSSKVQLSFYYDLFTWVGLCVLCKAFGSSQDFNQTLHWLSQSQNVLGICLYSLLVGVVANLVFFHGIKRTSGVRASILLLSEPIFATLFSVLLFGESITSSFVLASGLILCAQLPKEIFRLPSVALSRLRGFFESTPAVASYRTRVLIFALVFGSLTIVGVNKAWAVENYSKLKICHVSANTPQVLPRANEGKAQYGGFLLSIEEFNRKHTGRKLEFVVPDRKFGMSAEGVRWALDHQCHAVVGIVSSRDALIAVPALKEGKILGFTSTAATDLINSGYPYIQSAAVAASAGVNAFANYIQEDEKETAIYVITNREDIYSSTFTEHLTKRLGARIKVIALDASKRLPVTFMEEAQNQEKSIITYYTTYPIDSLPSLTQIHDGFDAERLKKIKVFGTNAWMENQVLKTIASELTAFHSVQMLSAWDSKSSRGKFLDFSKNYFKAYGRYPDHDSSYDFDVIQMIGHCFRNSNLNVSDQRAALVSCISKKRTYLGVTGKYKFDGKTAHTIRNFKVMDIQAEGTIPKVSLSAK